MPQQYEDPLQTVIQGMLQGHALATSIHRQRQEDEAFARHTQAQDREAGIQDIMNRMHLQQNARPVNSGTVMESLDPTLPQTSEAQGGLPDSVSKAMGPATSQPVTYARPVDKSRRVTYKGLDGQSQDYELLSPHEQLQNKISDTNALEDAKLAYDQKVAERQRQDTLTMEGGGTAAPPELAAVGVTPGARLTSKELIEKLKALEQLQSGDEIKTSEGQTVTSRKTGKVIATGGEKAATGDFPQIYLPAYAKAHGVKVEDLTPDQISEARSAFTGEDHNPTEAALAWKSIHGNPLERAQAEGALKRLDQSKLASRPVNQFIAPQNLPQGPVTIDEAPNSIRGTVQSIIEYRQPMPPLSRNNPTNQAIQFWVNKIAPNYSASEFPTRNKMLAGYTSGQQSKEISGINTSIGHIGVLGDAIDALHNGNVQVLNQLANTWGVQTGATPVTTFRAIVHKVAPELNRAYVGGVGSQGEIKSQESDFDPKLGNQQLKNNVSITAKLLRSKIGSLENQWKTTMKSEDFADRFMTPEAKAVMDKLSPSPAAGGTAAVKMKAPDGSIREVPSDQVEHYKSLGATAVK